MNTIKCNKDNVQIIITKKNRNCYNKKVNYINMMIRG